MTDPVPGTREDLVAMLRSILADGDRIALPWSVVGHHRIIDAVGPIAASDGWMSPWTAGLIVAVMNALPGLTKEIEAGRALIEHLTVDSPPGGWTFDATVQWHAERRAFREAYTAAREANTKETP